MSGIQQKVLLYISAAAWALTLVFLGIGVPDGFMRPMGAVSLLITALTFVYEKWGWAWIPTSISGVPDLRGTWHGTLRSTWNDPWFGAKIGPIETFVVIKQTASSVRFTLFSAESRSETILASMDKVSDAVEVVGVYRNEPQARVRTRSPIHYGGVRLRVGGPPPTALQGSYWTDRATSGDLELRLGSRTRGADFATCRALCGSMPSTRPTVVVPMPPPVPVMDVAGDPASSAGAPAAEIPSISKSREARD